MSSPTIPQKRPVTSPKKTRALQTTARTQPPESNLKVIVFKLHLPDIAKWPVLQRIYSRLRSTSRRTRILLGVSAIISMGCIAFAMDLSRTTGTTQQGSSAIQNPLDMLQRGTPKFQTVLPNGKSIEQLGGWTRISPPERDPVFAYVDTIGSVHISVSQQPLPVSFKNNPESKVRDVALSHGADKTISVDGKKIYIGTSANGPQSVIFASDRLLILIKSSSVVSDKEWENYIQSLS